VKRPAARFRGWTADGTAVGLADGARNLRGLASGRRPGGGGGFYHLDMLALVTFVTVLVISLIIVRVATVALTLTGLSTDIARFQARSAWTGTGFTTGEAERVLSHPVRRRIISLLMVARSAGLVTAASALVLSFVGAEDSEQTTFRLLAVVVFLFILWLVSMSSWVDRRLSNFIRDLLTRYTDLEAKDYASLLHLSDRFSIARLHIEDHDWLAGRKLKELSLPDEGVVVLGVERDDGSYTGAPRGETDIREGDTLLLYARIETLRDLDSRPKGPEGQARHYKQAAEQQEAERQDADRGGAGTTNAAQVGSSDNPSEATHHEQTGHASASSERRPAPPA